MVAATVVIPRNATRDRRQRRSRRTWIVAGLAVLVIGLLAALVVVMTGRRQSDEAAETGTRLLSQGDYRGAIPLLLRVATTRADDPSAHYLLGLAYQRIGWHGAALKRLSAAVRLAPSSPAFRASLGCAYRDTDNATAALRELEQSARLDPTDARYHVSLAEVLLELRRRPEAVQRLGEAVRLRPASAGLQMFLSRAQTAPPRLPGDDGDSPEAWRSTTSAVLAELARDDGRPVWMDGCIRSVDARATSASSHAGLIARSRFAISVGTR